VLATSGGAGVRPCASLRLASGQTSPAPTNTAPQSPPPLVATLAASSAAFDRLDAPPHDPHTHTHTLTIRCRAEALAATPTAFATTLPLPGVAIGLVALNKWATW